jgi:hypothetical protein
VGGRAYKVQGVFGKNACGSDGPRGSIGANSAVSAYNYRNAPSILAAVGEGGFPRRFKRVLTSRKTKKAYDNAKTYGLSDKVLHLFSISGKRAWHMAPPNAPCRDESAAWSK